MNINNLIAELDEVIEKLKMKLAAYQQENRELKIMIKELKLYVLNV
tara:strand:+ start:75 stop:212 length:138 start_codon:yes stop_codon:yes gene_type:complete